MKALTVLAPAALAALFISCVPVDYVPADPVDRQTARVQPFPGGGGFNVFGAYGLEGTITPVFGQPLWRFSAQFEFPTGGYSIGQPYLSVRGQRVTRPQAELEGYGGTVTIHLPVTPPPPDAMVTQAIEVVPVALDIPAGPTASFQVVVETPRFR